MGNAGTGPADDGGGPIVRLSAPPDRVLEPDEMDLDGFGDEEFDDEAGMTTAEYAVGTLAACSFAGLLLKLLTSAPVMGWLSGILEKALHLFG